MMTTASTTRTAETVELSTEYGTVYLTGREVAEIDADPVLSLNDVFQHRSEGDR